MTANVDWNRLIRACADLPMLEVLDEIPHCVPAIARVEVSLWDHQRRSLGALRSGEVTDRNDIGALTAGGDQARTIHHEGEDLGLLTVVASGHPPESDVVDAVAQLLAVAIRAKQETSDAIDLRRCRKTMSLTAEMQWTLLPPTQFTARGFSVAAAVEPAYDTAGDIFDYALSGNRLFAAVLDARGHGLRASATASVATSAMRRARRSGDDLATIAAEVAASIGALGDEYEFASAVMVELDVDSWTGTWLSAGHLPPLIVGEKIRALELAPALPLGLVVNGEQSDPIVQPLSLVPGESLVLYSDGIVENVALDDDFALGEHRFHEALLANFASDHAHDHIARMVVEDLLLITGNVIRDDATLLIVERPSSDERPDGPARERSPGAGKG